MTLVKKIDTERNRKLLVANRAMDRVTLALLLTLAAGVYKHELGALLAGLLIPVVTAIVASAKLMFDANVKVHQAAGGEPPAAGSTP